MKRTLIYCLGLLMMGFTANAQEELITTECSDDLVATNTLEGPTISQSLSLRQDDLMIPDKQDQVYLLKPKIDVPITVVGAAWSLYAFTKIYSKEEMPEEKVLALDPQDVNGIDRGA